MALAKHVILELYDCDIDSINSIELVESSLIRAVKISGCKILSKYFHKFSPQGVTGIVAVCESHFSIHTWPEHKYCAVDIFCCKEDISLSVDFLKTAFKSQRSEIKTITRGLV